MTREMRMCLVAGMAGGLITLLTLCVGPRLLARLEGQAIGAPPAASFRDRQATRFAAIGVRENWVPEERTNIDVYQRRNRGVVNITTKTFRTDYLFMVEVPAESGLGSGSILDRQGHILTNFHVVEGAQQISVTLFNGQSFEATAVGVDPLNDIAVLRIEAPANVLEPIPLSASGALRVGQKVYAIGNPFGFERTMTVGIISSLNRQLPSRSGRTMKALIQIDAALNQGNSGGPLLDTQGELIGMNTAIASQTGEDSGVGFAIPVTTLQRVVSQLIRNGRVIRPDLGITRFVETERGVIAAILTPGGPAEKGGLHGFRIVRRQQQRGLFVYERTYIDRESADLITAVDNVPVHTADELLTEVEKHEPGEQVSLTVERQGVATEVVITLEAGE